LYSRAFYTQGHFTAYMSTSPVSAVHGSAVSTVSRRSELVWYGV